MVVIAAPFNKMPCAAVHWRCGKEPMTDHLDKGPIRGEWQQKTLTMWRRSDGVIVEMRRYEEKWWALKRERGRSYRGGAPEIIWFSGRTGVARQFKTAIAAMKAVDKDWPLNSKLAA